MRSGRVHGTRGLGILEVIGHNARHARDRACHIRSAGNEYPPDECADGQETGCCRRPGHGRTPGSSMPGGYAPGEYGLTWTIPASRLPLTAMGAARSINDALYKPPLIGSPPLSPSPARIRSTLATIVDQADDLRELRLFHKALADINRLRIVRRLAVGHATVRDLIEHVGLSQPLVSWHLGRLRAAGLVATRRSGRETVCSLRPEAFELQVDRERELLGLGEHPGPRLDEHQRMTTAGVLPAQAGTADA